ncbi:MAG: hypothetical protein V2G47_01045, partial [bacterium JZ-2024 1]
SSIFRPRPPLSQEEVWKIIYPEGIPEQVSEEDLPRFVHPVVWESLHRRPVTYIPLRWHNFPGELEILKFRCYILTATTSDAHGNFYWGGALPLPDSVEIIQQAPYTLWKVKGVRTSPQPVEFNENLEVTNPSNAQAGDYFLTVKYLGPLAIPEYLMGCVVDVKQGKEVRFVNWFYPVTDPHQVSAGKGPFSSWDDLLRYSYWAAIIKQVYFAACVYSFEKNTLPKNREELSALIGEEIPEHWTPPVTALVNYFLHRLELKHWR